MKVTVVIFLLFLLVWEGTGFAFTALGSRSPVSQSQSLTLTKQQRANSVKLQAESDNVDEIRVFFGAVAGATAKAARDFSSALRFSAVNALTESLPKGERDLLLQRVTLNERNGEDDDDAQSSSVGENIAAAAIGDLNMRPREYDEEWRKEKELLLKQAEQAAMERVENELEIQKKRIEFLQSQLELAEDPSKIVDLATRQYSPQEYDAMSEGEKTMVRQLREQFPVETAQADTQAETQDHPLLGPVVLDLGYKRIHTSSVGRLGTIPVWNKQRIYRNDRVKSMAAQKWKNMHLGLPGIVCLHEDVNGKLTVLDGQHRIGMMLLLKEKQRMEQEEQDSCNFFVDNYCIDFDRILVEVYPEEKQPHLDDRNHAQEMFLEINKGEPVTLLDMPGVASVKDKTIITDAVEQLAAAYPDMFSPSQRCKPPDVNVDNMRDRLYGSGVLKRHDLSTSKKLLEWLVETNNLLAIKYESNESERRPIPLRAWTKASQNRFYLGLESVWYYT
jgi:hypothetical protein